MDVSDKILLCAWETINVNGYKHLSHFLYIEWRNSFCFFCFNKLYLPVCIGRRETLHTIKQIHFSSAGYDLALFIGLSAERGDFTRPRVLMPRPWGDYLIWLMLTHWDSSLSPSTLSISESKDWPPKCCLCGSLETISTS